MKKLLSLLAVATLTYLPAVPTEAQGFYTQGYYNRGYRTNINLEQQRILARLQANRASGRLTVREYNNLLRAYNNIAQMEARARMGGLTRGERIALNNRLANLRQRLYRQTYDNQFASRNWRWWY
jgi:hypothetical protein